MRVWGWGAGQGWMKDLESQESEEICEDEDGRAWQLGLEGRKGSKAYSHQDF